MNPRTRIPLNDPVKRKRKNGVDVGKHWEKQYSLHAENVTQLFHDAVSMRFFISNPAPGRKRLKHLWRITQLGSQICEIQAAGLRGKRPRHTREGWRSFMPHASRLTWAAMGGTTAGASTESTRDDPHSRRPLPCGCRTGKRCTKKSRILGNGIKVDHGSCVDGMQLSLHCWYHIVNPSPNPIQSGPTMPISLCTYATNPRSNHHP